MNLHRSINLLAFVSTLLLAVGCASHDVRSAFCTTPPPGIEDIQVLPLKVFTPDKSWRASVIPLSDGRIITARHAVPSGASAILIDDKDVNSTVIAEGTTDNHLYDDWAILKTSTNFQAPRNIVDFQRHLPPGTPIYLIGYPASEIVLKDVNSTEPPRRIVRGKVSHWDLRGYDPEEVVLISIDSNQNYYGGMSGGAAVIQDQKTGQWVIVGIFTNAPALRWLGLHWGTALIAVRPPAEAMAMDVPPPAAPKEIEPRKLTAFDSDGDGTIDTVFDPLNQQTYTLQPRKPAAPPEPSPASSEPQKSPD